MLFWLFPLLGACTLSLVTASKQNSLKTSINSILPFQIFTEKRENSLNLNLLSRQKLDMNTKTESSFNFLGNYQKTNLNNNKLNLKDSLNQNLEDLCFFYLNLTTKKLENPNLKSLLNLQKSELFFEKNLLQPLYFEKSNFHWIWNPLHKQMASSFSLNNTVFKHPFLPQKLEHFDFQDTKLENLRTFSSKNKNVLDLAFNTPSLSYQQAAKLFEYWLTNFEIDLALANKKNNQKFQNFSHNSSNLHSEILQNTNPVYTEIPDFSENFLRLLEKLYALENLKIHSLKKNQNFIFEFKSFLDFLAKNEKHLKTSFLNIQTKNFDINETGDNLKSRTNFNSISTSTTDDLNFLLRKIQNVLKKDFNKIMLQNYLKQQTDKNLLFKKKSYSNILGQTLDKKSESLDKTSQKVQKKLELSYMVKSNLFLNFSKLSNQNTQNQEYIFDSSNFETKLTKTTKELLLLKNWKTFLKRKTTDLMDQKLEKTAILNNEVLRNLNKSSLNLKIDTIKQENQKLLEEIYLHRQFEKICQKLFNVVLQKSMLEENANKNDRKLTKIFKYRSPFLISSLNLQKSNFFKNSESNNENQKELYFQQRMQKVYLENRPKTTNLPNTLTEILPFFGNSVELKNLSSEIFETKKTLFKTFLSSKKLDLKLISNLKFEKLNQLASIDDQFKLESVNKFNIVKTYKRNDNGKLYFFNFNTTLSPEKLLKLRKRYLLNQSFVKVNNRKAEKIFRTYSSVKGLKDKKRNLLKFSDVLGQRLSEPSLKPNKTTYQKLRPILEKLKNKVKTRKFILKNMRKKSLSLSSSNKSLKVKNFFPMSEFLSKNTRDKHLLTSFANSNLERDYVKTRKNKIRLTYADSSNFLNNLSTFNFLKKSDFLKIESDLTGFQKKKILEKKRRLKKLKLENRRRKKRKRFYPRPTYLRFNLYSQFLERRHFNQFDLSLKKSTTSPLKEEESKLQNFYSEKPFDSFKQKIYRQKKNRGHAILQNNLLLEKVALKQFSNTGKNPIYHQKEFYKISNETLTEFERLCWKSYWLRSNIKPYIRRIQQNLKQMQKIETFKNSNTVFSNITNDFIKKIQPGFLPSNRLLDFRPQSSLKSIAPFYLNIHENISKPASQLSGTNLFKNFENNAEYERLLYERITDEIKNVKSQLNVDGQTQPRSYKVGRQKVQKSNPTLFLNNFHAFQNNYFEPNVQGVLKEMDLNSSSIKPLGDLPTLRVLWACHKTNLFTYKENNYSKQIWTLYKQREQTKNNKTKKFVSKVFKFSPFQAKNLKSLSESKTKLVAKKIQLFGGIIYSQNYQTHLRNLKFKLQKTPNLKIKLQSQNSSSKVLDENSIDHLKQWFETNLENKLQKRSIHFWWSSQKASLLENKVPFFIFSPFVFSNFSDYIADNSNNLLTNTHFSESLNVEFSLNNSFITTTFWIASCLFHLAIFFTLVRIPEIRSLLKFQFLVLSKLANIYLIGLFSLYDLLKNYQTKLYLLAQKTFSFPYVLDNSFSNNNFNLLENFQPINLLKKELNFNASFEFLMNKTLNQASQKIQHSLPMQFTLTFEFYSRNMFEKLIRNVLKENQNSLKNNQSEKLNSILNTSIHPVFTEITPVSNKKIKNFFISKKRLNKEERDSLKNDFQTSISTKLIFDSWYSGFLWYLFSKTLNKEKLLKSKERYLKNFQQSFTKISQKNPKIISAQTINSSENKVLKTNEASVSKTIHSYFKIQHFLSLILLSMTKFTVQIFYSSLSLVYKLLLTGIDIMESILLLFYKFLEKPAELMVSWIADIFLVEWSSDVTTYIPEAFDRDLWISIKKGSRVTRFMGNLPFSFILQRMVLNSTEIFYSWLIKPDADLLTRQKKGVIFWDIWAEILIQAAETYKMNLSSLNSVKEEQELLIENLLEEKPLTKVNQSETKQTKANTNKKSTTFLNSTVFKNSLTKMQPLTKFLQEFPTNPSSLAKDSKTSFPLTKKLFPSYFLTEENFFIVGNPIKLEPNFSIDLFKANLIIEPSKRWAVNQYLTTQGRDTDLFMDIHPAKSFSHIRFLKTYLPAQEILSSIVCDIYAGLSPQRVSKNILIVGAPGATKGFFIQALAGETELKIVTDNAHRYAFVNGGVPIGMKLLRDVFDSLVLHTPCLFLLEDIHIIGERRPMLISDDELSKTKDFTFGAEQEEVHEKNRLLYEFSRHALSHYKKPYKGDFSASIPTNHFSYDLFLGVQPPRKRSSDLTPKSPLSMAQIEKVLTSQEGMDANNVENEKFSPKKNLLSFLQLTMEQIFAPPATSPFNILLLKEQKKLKPKKLVKEMPWSGLSYDQFMLVSKSQYSVRVKVALLAETAMTNLSIKLDMITDLLVIIDSVRSNRGFVVFATTHLPALLDPALRRPGRFDETLSLPLLPNLMTRFEIFKTTLSSYTTTTDFFDLSLLTAKQKQNENEISLHLSKALLLLLNTKNSKQRNLEANLFEFPIFSNFFNDYSIYSISQAFQTTISENSLLLNTNKFKTFLRHGFPKKFTNTTELKTIQKETLANLLKSKYSNILFAGNDKNNYISLSYGQAGQFLIESLVTKDYKTYVTKFLISKNSMPEFDNYEESVYQTLYSSSLETKNILLKLFAGKISEFFVLNNLNSATNTNREKNTSSQGQVQFAEKEKQSVFLSKRLPENKAKVILSRKHYWFSEQNLLQTNPSQSALFENIENFEGYWQSALSFLDSLYQKRYLYNKNSISSKMLFFEDKMALREPPSPPNSSILMPAKKFENYKRTFKDFIQKPMLSIQEKLQIHQKQRFLKLLYNIPIQNSFPTFSTQSTSKKNEKRLISTNFYTSFKELGYLDLITLKPTSSYTIYKNRFLTRHRFSFLNQWWNGQLAEHNVETTYLSHVDWRSMFVQSLGDLIIDFPDSDQYYNPKQRRWFLNSNSWSYWLDFEKTNRTKISEHAILQCFTKTSQILNQNRELFDYLAFRFLRYHQLKEFDLVQTLVRFYKLEEC